MCLIFSNVPLKNLLIFYCVANGSSFGICRDLAPFSFLIVFFLCEIKEPIVKFVCAVEVKYNLLCAPLRRCIVVAKIVALFVCLSSCLFDTIYV